MGILKCRSSRSNIALIITAIRRTSGVNGAFARSPRALRSDGLLRRLSGAFDRALFGAFESLSWGFVGVEGALDGCGAAFARVSRSSR